MKRMKKLASLLLAMVMVLSMTVTAFADDPPASGDGSNVFSITISNSRQEAVSMEGNTYSAYKLFDVTYNEGATAFSYTISEEFKGFEYTYKHGEEEETVSGEALVAYVAGLRDEASKDVDKVKLNDVAEKALKYAEDNSIAPSGKVEAGEGATSVTIDLDEAGYYLVAGSVTAEGGQTVTAACSLTTTTPTAEVTVKADAPSIDKKIVETTVIPGAEGEEGTPTEEKVDANNASVGDIVTYELTSNVPSMIGYEKYFFVVNDTMSKGLDFQSVSVIKVGSKELTAGTDYTVEEGEVKEDGSQDITIVFNDFIQYKGQEGDGIVIRYTAQVTEEAVIGNTGNPNEVTLTYSNNPNVKPSGDPENPDKPGPDDVTGETPKDIVITYVTGIKLIKYDGEHPDTKLAGAQFEIAGEKLDKVKTVAEVFEAAADGTYYKLLDGTYTTVVPTEGNSDKYESTETKYVKKTEERWITTSAEVKATGTSDAEGVVRFDGLAEGDYTIAEIKAPNGYNLLKDPITVKITCEEPDDDTISTGAETATWTVTTEKLPEGGEATVVDGIIQVTVPNTTGTRLPSTGGIGTTIFYAAGIILMAGAVFFVIRRRRA